MSGKRSAHDDRQWIRSGSPRPALASSTLFTKPLDRRDKISAANLLKSLEQILGRQKADWNYLLIRSLWTLVVTSASQIARSRLSTRKPG